jgi:hypothetical protein
MSHSLKNTLNSESSRLALNFPPLESITKPQFTTEEAAHYLNRSQQTLRFWAMTGKGAVTPIRINARLAWSVPEIKRLLGVA